MNNIDITDEMEITNKITDIILNSQEREYSPDVTQQFKRAFMDYICSAITGSSEPAAQQLFNYLSSIEKGGDCTVIGHSSKLSPPSAAFINGTSAHSLDFDDGHTQGSIHLGGVVFPAVLAVGEQYGSSPKEMIKAVITGYEIGGRLAAALHPHVWQRGFHNTPVIGIFGAVASVSTLLKSNKTEILNALGQAGSFSGGLFEFLGEGADVKRLHPGKAARDAIICVELARRNITGPHKVFEGKNGFLKAFANNQINMERLFQETGSEPEILNIYFKPYPCCRHLHGPIDAVKIIKKRHKIDLNQISEIEVSTYKVASKHSHYQTKTLLDAQMSIPCAVSLALVYEDVTIGTFQKEDVNAADVQSILKKVRVRINEKCEEIYPRHRSSNLTITLKNGERITEFVVDPIGESHTPLSNQELEKKFKNNSTQFIPEKRIEEIIAAIWNFEHLSDLEAFYNLYRGENNT
ncbi:MmgE/PrpD family protein [Peribacillus sp. NPDC097264]|uniref:MmgE/PrpD family protein n=1 Tax=Peribacillus sp. NPDC097264 TaxID=3390616 RepID=UPI003CFFEF40